MIRNKLSNSTCFLGLCIFSGRDFYYGTLLLEDGMSIFNNWTCLNRKLNALLLPGKVRCMKLRYSNLVAESGILVLSKQNRLNE